MHYFFLRNQSRRFLLVYALYIDYNLPRDNQNKQYDLKKYNIAWCFFNIPSRLGKYTIKKINKKTTLWKTDNKVVRVDKCHFNFPVIVVNSPPYSQCIDK